MQKLAFKQLELHNKTSKVYQNKVTCSLVTIQRPGYWAYNCKIVYSPLGYDVFPIELTHLEKCGRLTCVLWEKSILLLPKMKK